MLKTLTEIALKKTYWLALIIIAISFESVALYYQYALDEWPCVLCIHVRIWLMLLIFVSILALFVKRINSTPTIMHGLVTLIMLGMLERSWILLGVERGTIFGSCDMELGLPQWLAIDQWLPFIFEVKTACGYTPVLFAGITMAEVLMIFSCLMLLVSAVMVFVSLRAIKK